MKETKKKRKERNGNGANSVVTVEGGLRRRAPDRAEAKPSESLRRNITFGANFIL